MNTYIAISIEWVNIVKQKVLRAFLYLIIQKNETVYFHTSFLDEFLFINITFSPHLFFYYYFLIIFIYLYIFFNFRFMNHTSKLEY